MIYVALSALTLAVMILGAYVRHLYRFAAWQRIGNDRVLRALEGQDKAIRDLRRVQAAESILHALKLHPIDPMRN